MPWFSVVGSDINDDAGFRTYVTSGRILEAIGNHWTLLDLTPLGDPT